MKQLKIRTKFVILGVLGTIALLYIVSLAFNISRLGIQSVDTVYQESKQVQRINHGLISPIFFLRELSLSLVTAPNDDFRNEINNNIEPLIVKLDKKFRITDDKIENEWIEYKKLLRITQDFTKRGFEEGAFLNVNQEEREQFYKLIKTLHNMQNKELRKSAQIFEEAKEAITQDSLYILLVSGTLGGLIIFLGWFIIAKISNAIEQLKMGHSNFFNFLKNKNSNKPVRIELDTDDELGDMAKSINLQMSDAKETLKQDRKLIEYATKMLEEIKEGNLDKRLYVKAKSKELNALKSVINALLDDLEGKIQREIDQRTSQEKLLIQQSKLAAMGNMIGNIAHQWRQPLSELNAILMNIETRYKFKDFDEKFIENSVQECNEITFYMSSTISDFQNFFKPSKTKEYFNVVESCSKASSILRSSLKNHNITFNFNCDEDKEVYGYPNEFSQAFLNILSNAKDVLIQRETVDPLINVTIKIGKQYVLIKIEDNGGGILDKYMERIFEPYFTTKHAKQGTGIGLYMSKTIIENNMDGILNASNTQFGACFTIKLKI